MASVTSKRSVMVLFSGKSNLQCHRTRIVLAEKGISYEVQEVEDGAPPEDLVDLNPYQSVPTLIDRDLVLYDANVIIEYLDERFPHPPLMPVDPVSRAQARLAVHRIITDWYSIVPEIECGVEKRVTKARKTLRDALIASTEIFAVKPYFLCDDYTIMDATIAPLLWRLPSWGIELPKQCKAIEDYQERVFGREAFQDALTETERDLRD